MLRVRIIACHEDIVSTYALGILCSKIHGDAIGKHKGKVEFVGIACRDTEEKWKAATAKYELPWISVLNPADNDLVQVYQVKGFPTKIVVDPKGNIAKIILGEDPAFYTYLDSILD